MPFSFPLAQGLILSVPTAWPPPESICISFPVGFVTKQKGSLRELTPPGRSLSPMTWQLVYKYPVLLSLGWDHCEMYVPHWLPAFSGGMTPSFSRVVICLYWLPSLLFHNLISLLMFTGIVSQTNYLHSDLCLKSLKTPDNNNSYLFRGCHVRGCSKSFIRIHWIR